LALGRLGLLGDSLDYLLRGVSWLHEGAASRVRAGGEGKLWRPALAGRILSGPFGGSRYSAGAACSLFSGFSCGRTPIVGKARRFPDGAGCLVST